MKTKQQIEKRLEELNERVHASMGHDDEFPYFLTAHDIAELETIQWVLSDDE